MPYLHEPINKEEYTHIDMNSIKHDVLSDTFVVFSFDCFKLSNFSIDAFVGQLFLKDIQLFLIPLLVSAVLSEGSIQLGIDYFSHLHFTHAYSQVNFRSPLLKTLKERMLSL